MHISGEDCKYPVVKEEVGGAIKSIEHIAKLHKSAKQYVEKARESQQFHRVNKSRGTVAYRVRHQVLIQRDELAKKHNFKGERMPH